ncbi:MAG: FtsX-like permease family protein [Clostridia bacterium]|nr:FtsX-like permease family protein [Clostridia bacterium]
MVLFSGNSEEDNKSSFSMPNIPSIPNMPSSIPSGATTPSTKPNGTGNVKPSAPVTKPNIPTTEKPTLPSISTTTPVETTVPTTNEEVSAEQGTTVPVTTPEQAIIEQQQGVIAGQQEALSHAQNTIDMQQDMISQAQSALGQQQDALSGAQQVIAGQQSALIQSQTQLQMMAGVMKQIQNAMNEMSSMTEDSKLAERLDEWVDDNPDTEMLLTIYDQYIGEATYDDNLSQFGLVSYDSPSSISIYTDSYEDKDMVSACIVDYNSTKSEEEQIIYTDYIALLTSSLTTIINGISYVLIAFVAISLIVSCIMIGIITHISVMERTKEIGILRALGASKGNISQVFNAETFIIGCCSGLLGVIISFFALFPINAIIERVTEIENLNAQLPILAAVALIALSVLITIMGGIIPSRKAAKKDPVVALRTE